MSAALSPLEPRAADDAATALDLSEPNSRNQQVGGEALDLGDDAESAHGGELETAQAAAAAAAARDELAAAAAASDHERVIALVERLEEEHAAVQSSSLADAQRVLKFKALLTLGRADEAKAYLDFVERSLGRTHRTREAAAMFHALAGDPHAALDAINDSLAAAPLSLKPVVRAPLLRMKSELLSGLGRTAEAREALRPLAGVDFTSAYYRALRYSVQSPEEITAFEALALPAAAYKAKRARYALYHYSTVLRDFDMQERAFFAARERFLKTFRIDPFGGAPQAKSERWTKDAAIALHDLKADMAAEGLEFFLISGTLLGCVREKDIVGHDKDIDVGVAEDVPVEAVQRAMQRSKRFAVRRIKSQDSVYVQHANGVMIDIFRHFMEEGRYIHEGPKVRWWNTPFELISTEFLGGEYKVPRDHDTYLTENYGDWRTPVSEFETFVDTPNMIATSPEYLTWYYMTKLTDYYLWGKLPQFSRVWDAIAKTRDIDAELASVVRLVLDQDASIFEPRIVLTRPVKPAAARSRTTATRTAPTPIKASAPVTLRKRIARFRRRFFSA